MSEVLIDPNGHCTGLPYYYPKDMPKPRAPKKKFKTISPSYYIKDTPVNRKVFNLMRNFCNKQFEKNNNSIRAKRLKNPVDWLDRYDAGLVDTWKHITNVRHIEMKFTDKTYDKYSLILDDIRCLLIAIGYIYTTNTGRDFLVLKKIPTLPFIFKHKWKFEVKERQGSYMGFFHAIFRPRNR